MLRPVGVAERQLEWLERGSLCVWAPAPDGTVAAAMWWHTCEHVDRYLGRWSRPAPSIAYGNAMMTRADLRGRGYGQALLASAPTVLPTSVQLLRNAVAADNVVSRSVHEAVGYAAVGRKVGVRAGPIRVLLRMPS